MSLQAHSMIRNRARIQGHSIRYVINDKFPSAAILKSAVYLGDNVNNEHSQEYISLFNYRKLIFKDFFHMNINLVLTINQRHK